MLKFHTIYHPITSRPFLSNHTYREYQPCAALRSYIACYWSALDGCAEDSADAKEVLVIPDTCMDIIININHTAQQITGYLCGMQDRPYCSVQKTSKGQVTCFAVRFHFWSAHLFMDLDFKETRNQLIGLEALGPGWNALFEQFFYLKGINQYIDCVELFLLDKLNEIRENPNLLNSIHRILATSGRTSIDDICTYSCVSQRQMERLFLREIGLPIKRIANLVRYQNVWKDMALSPHFDVQDAVFRYGYTDQSHLLNEFKRFHGVTPKEAKIIALQSK
ncbi:helix-turn-helix domain-containing protein [Ruminococcus sp. OA3]|uniref:helix-turn-helix domain-containing protein n=1 Tax=Ruminococcus sp. OA3 TaxID=2914164 RepID=UPI001F065E42|nr:helix-turn-helix domain-containing protein [Ruminococcus sp. OA3]MCH1983293.1 helix-turn-helix domain-containing protein [Ruminococcus sp. OA3]